VEEILHVGAHGVLPVPWHSHGRLAGRTDGQVGDLVTDADDEAVETGATT
jgi:hypothetical protein